MKLEAARPDHDRAATAAARGAARRAARRRGARGAGANLAGDAEPADRPARPYNHKQALREARSCYDHLAGRAGVALADQLLAAGALEQRDGAFVVPERAPITSRPLRLRPRELRTRRPLVRACADWTERRPHVAGALGAALLDALLEQGWLRRRSDGRALDLTARGHEALAV